MKSTLLYFLPFLLFLNSCKPDQREEAETLWRESRINIIAISNSMDIGRNQFKDNIRQVDHLIAEMERQKDTLSKESYLQMKEELGSIRFIFERLSEAYFNVGRTGSIENIKGAYNYMKSDIYDPDLDIDKFARELKSLEEQTAAIRAKLVDIVSENDTTFAKLDTIREQLHAEWKTPS